jgi:asparagine synthase (glutamine-hydrolysing)
MKLRGMNGKYIFKKTLNEVLPRSVLNRKKMGFGVPLAQWLRNDLREFARAVIFDQRQDSFLNDSSVNRIWQEHQRGFRDRSTELWSILMFRLWQREFLTMKSRAAA